MDGTGGQVYITRHRRVYHTDPDCQSLKRADNVLQRRLSLLHDDIPHCKRCAGELTRVVPSNHLATVQLLEELNPDDVG